MTAATYDILEILDNSGIDHIEKIARLHAAGFSRVQLDEAVKFYAVRKYETEEKIYTLMAVCGMKAVMEAVNPPINQNGSEPKI